MSPCSRHVAESCPSLQHPGYNRGAATARPPFVPFQWGGGRPFQPKPTGRARQHSAATVHEPAPLITPFSLVFSRPQTAKICKKNRREIPAIRHYAVSLAQIHIFSKCFFCAGHCKSCFSQYHFRLRHSRACVATLAFLRIFANPGRRVFGRAW